MCVLIITMSQKVPCTVRNSRQRRTIKVYHPLHGYKRVVCLYCLGSRAFGPAKKSDLRLLSTIPGGMIHYLFIFSVCMNSISKKENLNPFFLVENLLYTQSRFVCLKHH